jgi:hypothetical protein
MRRASPVRVLRTTVRPCPAGRVAASRRSRRAASIALVAGNGSGPEGSSLTADYPRSRGSGTEKCADQSVRRLVDKFSGLATLSLCLAALAWARPRKHWEQRKLARPILTIDALPLFKLLKNPYIPSLFSASATISLVFTTVSEFRLMLSIPH